MTEEPLTAIQKYIDSSTLPLPDPRSRGLPYVAFLHTGNSTDFTAVVAANPGANLNEPYLVSGGSFKILRPLRFMLRKAHRYWALYDQSGKAVKGTYRTEDPSPTPGRFSAYVNGKFEVYTRSHPPGSKVSECLYVAGLVLDGESVVPATIRLKNANMRAGEKMLTGARLAADPEAWMARGPAYQVSAAMPAPWLRYYTRVTTAMTPPKYGQGNSYPTTEGEIIPISREDGRRVLEFLAGKEAGTFDAVLDTFDTQVMQLESLR